MTRRKLITTFFGATAAVAAYPCLVEPRWLETSYHRVRLASRLGHPVRIAHLSDLHASLVVPPPMIDHAVTTALAQKPNVICLTGDFITGHLRVDRDHYRRILQRLSAAAPSFAVLGNHDGGIWARERLGYSDHRPVERLLEESGITLLHNRSASIEVGDQKVTFAGVGDLWSDEVDAYRAFRAVHAGQPVIALAHNPDTKDAIAPFRWDLMLSGHTHGGQIVVPFEGPIYAPVVDRRYVAGLKPWGDRQIHVSKGVGNLASVRFRCRPEVCVLDLLSV